MGKVARICSVLRPGWHIKEELPIFLLLLVGVMLAMSYWNVGTWEQRFGTGFLVAAILVSLEVVYATVKCRM